MNDEELGRAMRAYLDNLTKPRGSLGKLEEYCEKMARIQGRVPPGVSNKAVYVLGGDRGGFVVQLCVLCALNMAAFDSADVSGKDLEERKY